MRDWLNFGLIGASLAAALALADTALARSPERDGWPDPYREMRSIGNVIAEAKTGETIHIFYVHGMRADAHGASKTLVRTLTNLQLLPGARIAEQKRWFVKLGPRPQGLQFAGRSLWTCADEDTSCDSRWDEAWQRSTPFIDRTTIDSDGARIIVHEVNWWPLTMGLKCRALVAPEADLSGDAREQLRLCASDVQVARDAIAEGPYFPWISRSYVDRLLRARPRSGGGVLLNGRLKRDIVNWGLADAVIALGPMKDYLRQTLDQASHRALADAPSARERVVIAESLGSFITMDAARDGQTASLISETRHFYFLANQFALLELGRVGGVAEPATRGPQEAARGAIAAEPSPLQVFRRLAGSAAPSLVGTRPVQVVAVNDPSDILTYDVPRLDGIKVANLYWRFSGDPFRLVADPKKAHRGGVDNNRLWKMLLTPNPR